MTRKKKIDPQPPARDPLKAWGDVPVDDIVECKRLSEIVERGGRRISEFDEFCFKLREACHEASWDISERSRKKPKPKKPSPINIALGTLASSLRATRAELTDLGADAANTLQDIAGEDLNDDDLTDIWQLLEPRGLESGAFRIDCVDRMMNGLEIWAETAQAEFPRRGRGRPSKEIERALINKLIDIWTAQTGKRPTSTTGIDGSNPRSGDFLDFCNAVIIPILDKRREPQMNVDEYLQKVLYPPSKK